MKIVINKCYGGFSLSDEAMEILAAQGVENLYDADSLRTDSRLISLIEERGSKFCSTWYSDLVVVEIEGEVTDWVINGGDGLETLLYVVDGKIYYA